jgi:hypothetical protein
VASHDSSENELNEEEIGADSVATIVESAMIFGKLVFKYDRSAQHTQGSEKHSKPDACQSDDQLFGAGLLRLRAV